MRTLLATICLLSTTTFAGATTIFDETNDGDLSSDPVNPTALVTSPGVNTVIGSTIFSPVDRDFFTVTIAPGQTLASIVLAGYVPTPASSGFLAVESGLQISSLVSAAALLGTALINVPDVTTDVLDNLGLASLGGAGFVGPLGPGDYTFWFQETGADVDYEFDLHVTPEPSSVALLGLGVAMIGAFGWRRRRKLVG